MKTPTPIKDRQEKKGKIKEILDLCPLFNARGKLYSDKRGLPRWESEDIKDILVSKFLALIEEERDKKELPKMEKAIKEGFEESEKWLKKQTKKKKCGCHYQCGCNEGECNCYSLTSTPKKDEGEWEQKWDRLHPNLIGLAVEKVEKDFIRQTLSSHEERITHEQYEKGYQVARDRYRVRERKLEEWIREDLVKKIKNLMKPRKIGTLMVTHPQYDKALQDVLTAIEEEE